MVCRFWLVLLLLPAALSRGKKNYSLPVSLGLSRYQREIRRFRNQWPLALVRGNFNATNAWPPNGKENHTLKNRNGNVLG